MLIDDVAQWYRTQPNGDVAANRLREAFVVDVQNVADYFYQNPKNYWQYSDFPNIAPPFDLMWSEWLIPQWMNHEGHVEQCSNGMRGRYGVLMQSHEFANDVERRVFFDYPKKLNANLTAGMNIETDSDVVARSKWGCVLFTFIRLGKCDPMFLSRFIWAVSDDGEILKIGEGYCYTDCISTMVQGRDQIDKFMSSVNDLIFIPLLSLSFLHCKNVVVKKCSVARDKVQRSRIKDGKLPFFNFHTIVIEPVKKIIRDVGGQDVGISPRSLHICRGHFKDFSVHGLFGKYKGRYWWPMHKRGDADIGVTDKDYLIKGVVN